jgi:hypothetical protein
MLSEFNAGLLMFQLQFTAPVKEFVSVHEAELKVTRVGSGVTAIEISELGVSRFSGSGLVGVSVHALLETTKASNVNVLRS